MTALEWAIAQTGTPPTDEVYCPARDVAQARVARLQLMLERGGWDETQAALITAILGEITGNCFDHNLGQWRDVPGCWFEYQVTGDVMVAEVADRGQGILGSLRQVRPQLQDHHEALHLAFTEQLSGRAPEKRGNGLKFVMRSLTKLPSPHFLFYSGNARLELALPLDINHLDAYITPSETIVLGTYALVRFAKVGKL